MKRTKEEAEETRLNIILSAMPIFASRGPSATSLTDVAKAAGVTRGAIYWHFKNKWDLLDAIFSFFTEPVNTLNLESPEAQQPDPLGDLRNMLVNLLSNVAVDETYRQVFMLLAKMNTVRNNGEGDLEEIHARFQFMMEQKHKYRVVALENAIRQGQLPEDLDPQAGSAMISAMIEGLVFNSMAMPEFYRLDLRAEQYADAILSTLHSGLKKGAIEA